MAYFWTAFEWQAYDDKTAHLSLVEHGAYIQLLRNYYKIGGPIRANLEQVLRLCRASAQAELEAVQRVLDEFFVLQDGYYHHSRCDEELQKASELRETKANAGRLGGLEAQRKKRASAKAPAQADAQACAPTVNKGFVFNKELEPYREDWDQFEVMRRKIRKPMTDQARRNICEKLLRFKATGYDPAQILQNSITNSWQDVYPPKENPRQQQSYISRKNPAEEMRRQLEAD